MSKLVFEFPPHEGMLSLIHNPQKSSYQTVQEYLKESERGRWVTPMCRDRSIKTDELWELRWYPKLPLADMCLYAVTLEDMFNALICMQETREVHIRSGDDIENNHLGEVKALFPPYLF